MLSDETLLRLVKLVFIFILSGVAVRAMVWLAARSRPAAQDADTNQGSGRIRPSRPLMAVCTLLGLGVGGVALYGASLALDPNCACQAGSWRIPAALGTAFVLLGLYCSLSLTSGWDMRWDQDGVEGPTSMLFPPFGPRRERLSWEDIVAIGGNSNSWYVETPKGRRMWWNSFYAGYPKFMLTVENRRPDLFADIRDKAAGHA